MFRLQWVFHSIKNIFLGFGLRLILISALMVLSPSNALALYIQIDSVADIKTTFSEGCSSIEDLATQAERQKIDVLLFGDLARNSIEFGIKPFERIFTNTTPRSSVLERGAGGYISEIRDNDRKFERTLLIPGVETIPFYFWSGSHYDENLMAHNWDKHLLVFGMDTAQDIEQLPLPNSNFSKNYIDEFRNNFIIIAFISMLTVGAVYKGYFRIVTVPLMLFFALLTINNHPFQSSPFDPYHGDRGIEPYQNLIDYATSKGALVFWNHMETDVVISQEDNTVIETLPYPDDLLTTQNYTGFQAVGDKPIHQTEPGQQWDQVLMQYLNGEREHPVWGFGGSDYLCENQNNNRLGSVRTILLVRERNNETVLDAMKNGRMYAVRQSDENRLSLDEFIVENQNTGNQVTMGEELVLTDFPSIKLKLRTIQGGNKTAHIQIIRNGVLVKSETVSLPYELIWRDVGVSKREPLYYRIKAQLSAEDHLVSNPIFVKFGETTEMNYASIPTSTSSALPQNLMIKQPVITSVTRPEAPQEIKLPMAMKEPTTKKPPRHELPPSKRLTIIADGAALKKGPGTVFSNITKLRKGEEVDFVRRTNIEFNKMYWLMVKHRNRFGYIWEGVVK